MSNDTTTHQSRRVKRRPQLASVALVVAIVASVLAVGSGMAAAQSNETFIVQQGNTCTQVQPLGNGSQSVSSFYDYRSTVTDKEGLYSSYGTRDIQQANTSQVFVYNGSDGLSLVFLTGKLGSASAGQTGGGSTYTTDITGLPPNGKWVVEDDRYNHNDDTFQTNLSGGRQAHLVQVQNGNRTDGAAFVGLGSANYRAIHVRIRFNQYSAIYPYEKWRGSPAQNRISQWVVRSGDGKTTPLNMTRPITVAPGTCAGGIEHPTRSSTTPIGPNETSLGPYIPSENDTPAAKNPDGPPLTEPMPTGTTGSEPTGTPTTMTTRTVTETRTRTATTTATRTTTVSSANETTTTTRTGSPLKTTEQASGGDTTSGNDSSGNGSDGGGGSGAFGPGFGIGIAVIGVLTLSVVALASRTD